MDDIKPGSIIYINNPPVEIKGEMTLRDYFAAKAMQSIVNDPRIDCSASSNESTAKTSYEIADAMLKARMEKNHE